MKDRVLVKRFIARMHQFASSNAGRMLQLGDCSQLRCNPAIGLPQRRNVALVQQRSPRDGQSQRAKAWSNMRAREAIHANTYS